MTINSNIDVHVPEPPDAANPGGRPTQEALGFNHVRVRLAGLIVDIELNPTDTVPPPYAPVFHREPVAAPQSPATTDPKAEPHYLRSPIVGTFYLAPEPGSAPFVSVGDSIAEGQQIGIVEAMKLMNRIDADTAGRVVEILVPDATSVEYDQPLIALEPE